MLAFVLHNLTWVLSAITIASTLMAGNLHRHAWALSACNQVLWFTWIMSDYEKNKGLLPMNLVLAVLFIRNHFKWKKPGTISAGPCGPTHDKREKLRNWHGGPR